jgi:hypothetical protein
MYRIKCFIIFHKLGVKQSLTGYENRALKKTLGLKREEEKRLLRELYKEELQGVYFSPTVIKSIK